MQLPTPVFLALQDATNVFQQLTVKVAQFLSFSKELPVNLAVTMDSQLSETFAKDVPQDA